MPARPPETFSISAVQSSVGKPAAGNTGPQPSFLKAIHYTQEGRPQHLGHGAIKISGRRKSLAMPLASRFTCASLMYHGISSNQAAQGIRPAATDWQNR